MSEIVSFILTLNNDIWKYKAFQIKNHFFLNIFKALLHCLFIFIAIQILHSLCENIPPPLEVSSSFPFS